jgi:hypothetical protein
MQTPGFGGKLVFAAHWASIVQAPHLFMVVSQMGVVPEQLPSPVHWTQTLALEQTGVPPTHWLALVAEHWAQAPPARQAGALALFALHAASPVHAMHLFAVLSQIGVVPEHCESSVHCTHTLPVEQTGVPPVHWLPLVAEHCAHVPPKRQAGAIELFALQAASPVHAVHLFAVLSQIGVAPEHCESLVHCTQTFEGEQAGRPASPAQSLSTPHSAQAPLARQAGVARFFALHCPKVAQAEQTCVVVLQIGAKGDLQSVLWLHATHAPAEQTGVVDFPAHCASTEHSTQVLA